MEWIALIVVALVVVGLIQGLSGRKSGRTPNPAMQDATNTPFGKQDRLTNNQMACLSSASMSQPIYAENPSHAQSQMPAGAACFNLRTVESLVKRGFLASDQRGGYLLTEEGMMGLKRGMGFRD